MTLFAKVRQDATFGARYLYKHPNYSVTTLLTLVMTITAVGTMFTMIDHVLLRPLPAPDPSELVSVEIRDARTGNPERSESVPFATFRSWQDAAPANAELAWGVIESSVLTETDIGIYMAGHLVSGNFPALVGIEPLMGRWFTEDEAGQPVVMISYEMWQRDLDRDENIIGRTISLDKLPFTVIGVMPPGYVAFLEPRVRYWRPVDDFGRGGGVIGRLPAGATSGYVQDVTSRLDRVLERDLGAYAARIVPLQERLVTTTRSSLWLLMGCVCALFVVAILNLTNLTFAHLHHRIRELTTRAALGATRANLVRQLIAENLTLSIVAAVVSVAATAWLLELVLLMMPESFPRKSEIALDARMFGFTAAAAIGSGMLVTLVPSLRIASPARLIEHMKHGSSRLVDSFGSVRLRRHLIAAQVGVALILLVAVGLLLGSYVNLVRQDTGFNPERVITGHVWRPEGMSDREVSSAFDRVLTEVLALPDVSLVAAASTIPMGPIATRVDPTVVYRYRGQPPVRDAEETRVALRTVTDDYFRVLDVPLVAGRFFDGTERTSGNRTLIVNRAMAEIVWRDRDAIGQELLLQRGGNDVAYTVVGVTESYRFDGLHAEPKPEVFLSMSQTVFGGATFVAKTRSENASATMAAMSGIASRIDNAMPMIELHRLDDLVRDSVDSQQSVLSLLVGFAFVATLLAGVGIYGLTSYLIGCRVQEIAIRIALGANRNRIKLWVMTDAAVPALVGVGLGLLLSIPATRLLASFLFGVDTWSWQAYGGAVLIIALVALLAPIGPAARAARVRPNRALNAE